MQQQRRFLCQARLPGCRDTGANSSARPNYVAISGESSFAPFLCADNIAKPHHFTLVLYVHQSPVTASPTDPLILNLNEELVAKDGQSFDHFGSTLDTDMKNGLIIVGSPAANTFGITDSGAASIFKEVNGTFHHLFRIQANDLAEHSNFGAVTAISDTVAAITSHTEGNGTAVYVFGQISGTTLWDQQAKLSEDALISSANGNGFGVSIDLLGNSLLLVGADHYHSTGPNCGAVFIYERVYYSWFKIQTLTPSSCTANAHFGRSVKFDRETGDRLIVGSIGDSSTTGSAHIYMYNASDTKWYLEADIFATDGEPGDAFGVSVALNANRAIVGANQDDTDFGGVSVGSAYMFQLGNETGWEQEAKLGNSDGMGGDGFGTQVAIHRNTAIVSAPADDISDIEQDTRGSVYFYGLLDDEDDESHDWLQIKKLSGSNENATLGSSIALYEDTVFVGAPREFVDGSKEQGLVYVYEIVRTRISCLLVAPYVDPLNDDFFLQRLAEES